MPQAIFWYIAAALAAIALLALTPAHASIEWDFTPTSIIDCPSGFCVLTGTPVISLILDSPDSSGSASYNPNLRPLQPLSVAGDPFSLSIAASGFAAGHEQISSTNPLGSGTLGQFENTPPPQIIPPWAIQDYFLSWSESGGVLDAVLISFDTVQDSIFQLNLIGGRLASDNILGGCGECDVTGVWIDSSPVREPCTLALLLGPFMALGLLRSRYAG